MIWFRRAVVIRHVTAVAVRSKTAVVKGGTLPRHRSMAHFTSKRKAERRVIWVSRVRIVTVVAPITAGRDPVMTEHSAAPRQGRMAILARGWKAQRIMIGVCGGVKLRHVALHAVVGNTGMAEDGPLPCDGVVA